MKCDYGIISYLLPWYAVLRVFWESLRPTISCRSISMTLSWVSHLDSRSSIFFSCSSHLPFRVCTSILRSWTVSSSSPWAGRISSGNKTRDINKRTQHPFLILILSCFSEVLLCKRRYIFPSFIGLFSWGCGCTCSSAHLLLFPPVSSSWPSCILETRSSQFSFGSIL